MARRRRIAGGRLPYLACMRIEKQLRGSRRIRHATLDRLTSQNKYEQGKSLRHGSSLAVIFPRPRFCQTQTRQAPTRAPNRFNGPIKSHASWNRKYSGRHMCQDLFAFVMVSKVLCPKPIKCAAQRCGGGNKTALIVPWYQAKVNAPAYHSTFCFGFHD